MFTTFQTSQGSQVLNALNAKIDAKYGILASIHPLAKLEREMALLKAVECDIQQESFNRTGLGSEWQ